MSETRAVGAGLPVEARAAGWLGYTRLEAGTAATPVEQTVAHITVTVGASRRIRVLWHGMVAGTTSGTRARVRIKEGSAVLQTRDCLCAQVDKGAEVTACVHLEPSAGSHTYTVTLDRESGKGVVSIDAGPSSPAELIVEDLGAV